MQERVELSVCFVLFALYAPSAGGIWMSVDVIDEYFSLLIYHS